MVSKEDIIQAARIFVEEELKDESSGHDWWHIYRVTKIAKKIARMEQADLFVCELAALFHDIADEKLNQSEAAGLEKVKEWFEEHHVEEATIKHIMEIISTMSFKGGGGSPMTTLEGQIVQDADRLDAIGAIGMARTFAYSGAKGQLIYDPTIKPRDTLNHESYRNEKSTAINHFYEKLLKLKDSLNTNYAQKIADHRHQLMEDFLQNFFLEWEGED